MSATERPQENFTLLHDQLGMTREEFVNLRNKLVKGLIETVNDPKIRKKAAQFHREATRISPKDRLREFTI